MLHVSCPERNVATTVHSLKCVSFIDGDLKGSARFNLETTEGRDGEKDFGGRGSATLEASVEASRVRENAAAVSRFFPSEIQHFSRGHEATVLFSPSIATVAGAPTSRIDKLPGV